MRNTLKGRADWLAHFWKALVNEPHASLRPLIRSLAAPDAIVLDIGAQFGQFAKLISPLIPNGHLYAFEPGSRPRSVLTGIVALRRLRNVTIVPLALGRAAGQAVLSTPIKRSGAVGFGLAHLGTDARPSLTDQVEVATLDGFATTRGLTRIDLIKADIEGWEGEMLAGATATLARLRPALLLELDHHHLLRAGTTPAAIEALLTHAGYQAWPLDRTAPLAPGGVVGDGDTLFLPRP